MVSPSSAEAEYPAVANVVAECCWLRQLFGELRVPLPTTTVTYCDNISVVYMAANPVHHRRTKHNELDIHFVREKVVLGQMRVLHVPTAQQFADIMTKGLPTPAFQEFRSTPQGALLSPFSSLHRDQANVQRDSGRNKELDKELMIIKDKEKEKKKQETVVDSGESEMGRDSAQHQSLMEEIISVERERKDLLASLSPTFSLWKEIDSQTTWTIATTTFSRDNNENPLADYLNLILQAMEDLGHRMLSTLYFLNKSDDSVCSYKATELCNTATKLNMHIKGFSPKPEPEPEPEPEEQPGQIDLSSLFRKYCRFPDNYNNTLARLDMEEHEENKCEDVHVKKTKEEEDKEKDVSSKEYLKKRMDIEQQFLANHRKSWENVWGSRIGWCGGFMDTTILSPMQFTHHTPGSIPSPAAITGSTLQIYSIKIKSIKGLNWPLRVYGEVAARDTVDRNRNILFSRSRFDYQELNGEDDCLCLTGPSRAIVALDHVEFEVDLQVANGGESQTLISCRGCYGFFSSLASVTDGDDGCTLSFSNKSCRVEVTLDQIDKSLQATIVGVHVTKGRWPFKYGCRVVCSWSPAAATDVIGKTCRRVVLLDHRGKGMHRRPDKHLHLSRRVVSVESHGMLRVSIEAYGKSRRCIAREGHINFPVQQCQTRRIECQVGDSTVEVAVGWSLLVKEKALLTVMRQSRMEMEMEMDSDSDSDSGSGSCSGHEMDERDSSKERVRDASGKEIVQMANDLVGVLSGHLGMLKREISFLRTEVKSRGLAGNRACQEQIMSNLGPLDENLLKKVNLPYLGSNTEEVMDFLLVETQQLLYRFNSLASILQKVRIPISSDKIDKLRLISNALVGISELIIKRHKSVASDSAGWEATWGSSTGRHGCFDDITTLSPMQFTASTPGSFPSSSVAGPALEIYSIKLINLNPNLSWPIDVYGVVAARDDFDHNRNILFCRSSADCQRINQEDPFLHLIGPSRAIVAEEPVMFQIELKLKYGANFKDTALFTSNQSYRSIMPYDTMQIYNRCCTAEISLGRVDPAIQATIVGVCVTKGEWPFKYGCKVSCLFSPADATEGCAAEVVLLDRRAKRMRAGSDGYLSLSRNVVSVGLQGTLRVVTEAYSESGLNIVRKYHAEFPIQQCQIDSCECSVDGSTLKIVVAWSRLAIDKDDLVNDGY
ncbi:uncharacterized protein [Triticum aestivum]|uniref:uncharacterized protein n=1 Tax=Triticum aestivum TaxID=4565 RepID=UPI001D02862E|nr:uncharacterized protein LOC123039767 [Triticum aestivum]